MIFKAVSLLFLATILIALDASNQEYTIIESCLDKSKINVNEKPNLKIVSETNDKICVNIAVKKTTSPEKKKIIIDKKKEKNFVLNFDKFKTENKLLKINLSSFLFKTKECILIQEEKNYNKQKFEIKAFTNFRLKCQLKQETINTLLTNCSLDAFKDLSVGKIFFYDFTYEGKKGFSNIHDLNKNFIKKDGNCEFPNQIEYSLVHSEENNKFQLLGTYSRFLNTYTISEKNKYELVNLEVNFQSIDLENFEYIKNKGNNIWNKFIEFFHLLLKESQI